jgi:hypothetical protein
MCALYVRKVGLMFFVWYEGRETGKVVLRQGTVTKNCKTKAFVSKVRINFR